MNDKNSTFTEMDWIRNNKKLLDEMVKSEYKMPKYDFVNHPPHYESGKFECIEVMRETQGDEAVQNFCICNAMKYIYRHRNKNGVEDIKKAKWYIDKYLEIEGDRPHE